MLFQNFNDDILMYETATCNALFATRYPPALFFSRRNIMYRDGGAELYLFSKIYMVGRIFSSHFLLIFTNLVVCW